MAISFIGANVQASTSATPVTHAVGDLIVGFITRSGNATAPGTNSAYTSIGTKVGGTTTTAVSTRLVYRVATTTSDGANTFTNATGVGNFVYRPGAGNTISIGVSSSANSGNSSVPSTSGKVGSTLTLQDTSGASWVFGALGSNTTTSITTAPTGMTNRGDTTTGTGRFACFDTNGGVTSWSAATLTVASGTSTGWALEIKEVPPPPPDAWSPPRSTGMTLTNADKTATGSSTAWSTTNYSTTGKYYVELTCVNVSTTTFVGFENESAADLIIWEGNGTLTGDLGATIQGYANGNVLGMAIDLGAGSVWFATINSTSGALLGSGWNNSGTADPATGTGGQPFPSGLVNVHAIFTGTSGTTATTINTGDSAFVISGGAPSGFSNWYGSSGTSATGAASGSGSASATGVADFIGVGSASGSGSAVATGKSNAQSAGSSSGSATATATGESNASATGAASGSGFSGAPLPRLVAHQGGDVAGVNNITSVGIDTTGASLIVIAMFGGNGTFNTPTDAEGNTYTLLKYQAANGRAEVHVWYCLNPVTSSSHVFLEGSSSSIDTYSISAWANVGDADQQNSGFQQGDGSTLTQSTGSITPTQANELILALLGIDDPTDTGSPQFSFDSGFTLLDSFDVIPGSVYGGLSGYLVQSTAAPVNPTLTRSNAQTTGHYSAAVIQSFKPSTTIGSSQAVATGSSSGSGTATGQAPVTSVGAASGSGTAAATGQSQAAATGAASGFGTAAATGQANFTGVGSSSGSSSTAATGRANFTGTGSVSGAGSATGTGQSNAVASGSTSGSGAASAVGQETESATGSSSGSGSALATGQSNAVATGSSSGAGSAQSQAEARGFSAGAGGASGVGQSQASATGSSAGSGASSGSGQSDAVAVGSATGSGSASAVGLANFQATGSSSGSGSAQATGQSDSVGTGSTSGSGVATALASGSVVGSASGVSVVSAVGQSDSVGTGSTSGSGSVTSVGQSQFLATGASSGGSTVAGIGQETELTTGSTVGSGSVSAVGQSHAVATGTASGSGVASGFNPGASIGAASGVATVSAVGQSHAVAVGSATGSGAASAVGSAKEQGTGTSSGTGSAAATGRSNWVAAGAASGSATVNCSGQSQAVAVGSATGSGAASGIGAASHGAASGSASVSGVGQSNAVSVGQVVGSASASGAGLQQEFTVGTSTGAGSVSSQGSSQVVATGTASGSSDVESSSVTGVIGIGGSSGSADVEGVGSGETFAVGTTSGEGDASDTQATGAAISVGTSAGSASVASPDAAGLHVAMGTGTASGGGSALAFWRRPIPRMVVGVSSQKSRLPSEAVVNYPGVHVHVNGGHVVLPSKSSPAWPILIKKPGGTKIP